MAFLLAQKDEAQQCLPVCVCVLFILVLFIFGSENGHILTLQNDFTDADAGENTEDQCYLIRLQTHHI